MYFRLALNSLLLRLALNSLFISLHPPSAELPAEPATPQQCPLPYFGVTVIELYKNLEGPLAVCQSLLDFVRFAVGRGE